MKTCSACGAEKPLTDFYASKVNRDGLEGRCKTCKIKAQSAYQRTDKGKASVQRARIKYRYGKTQADYDAQLEAQGGGCAICKTTDPAPRTRFSWDHDQTCCPVNGGQPTCGKCVRGLLCLRCNSALGWSETHQAQIAEYLASSI